jgi:hypothetical protein
MPTARAQSRVVNRARLIEFFPTLFTLAMETRLEIYSYLLLPQLYVNVEGRASSEAEDVFETKPADLANPQQPSSENRETFSQLLLVCKTIHCEAAPLFSRKATFFIREPFAFANTFLRKLAHDKVYSLRSLELRMTYKDFNFTRPWYPNSKIKVLYNLLTTFHTYNKELRGLRSVTLTLVVKDSISPINHGSNLLFHPPHDLHLDPIYADVPLDCMWEAGQGLAKIMSFADFELSQSVEDVYEKGRESMYLILRGTVARVKLQRTR